MSSQSPGRERHSEGGWLRPSLPWDHVHFPCGLSSTLPCKPLRDRAFVCFTHHCIISILQSVLNKHLLSKWMKNEWQYRVISKLVCLQDKKKLRGDSVELFSRPEWGDSLGEVTSELYFEGNCYQYWCANVMVSSSYKVPHKSLLSVFTIYETIIQYLEYL